MKLYLDDKRPCPEEWTLVCTAREAIEALKTGLVTELSLDHDLGDLDHDPEETGYTVLQWVENETYFNSDFQPPKIKVHSANVAIRTKMELGIEAVKRILELREQK